MKKIVIATMLVLLLVSMLVPTVFAKPQPPNPKANDNACFGQAARAYFATVGEAGAAFRDAATNDYGHGAATEIQEARCGENCGQCTPKCD